MLAAFRTGPLQFPGPRGRPHQPARCGVPGCLNPAGGVVTAFVKVGGRWANRTSRPVCLACGPKMAAGAGTAPLAQSSVAGG